MTSTPARPPLGPWLGPLFAALAVCLVPWTVFLAVQLPERSISHHYDLAWTGFDVALIAMLGATALTAKRHSRYFSLATTATATMLVVDAWFDVVTSQPGGERIMAVVLAVIVELPLAALCLWWGLHAQDVLAARVQFFRRRARVSAVGGHVGEQAADRLAEVDAVDRLGEQRRH